ncbi:MAG: methyltransferase domain-containing protein [Hungatella sp.]
MNDISKEINQLLHQYGNDTKRILERYSRLDYLYALSDMRENLLEWYPFAPEARLLQVGSDYGALTGLYGRRVKEVVVLDPSAENLKVNRLRHGELDSIDYREGTLIDYAAGGEVQLFDYVVMIGSLEPDYATQLAAAKSLLKPDGILLLAVCNLYGMHYLAGAKGDEVRISKQTLTQLVGGNDPSADYEYYYPIPDYKLPVSIYSQSYLPGKGDLTHPIPVYDYPKYLSFDLGEAYDSACEDGQFENFANSFFMIWRNHGSN